MNQQVDLQDLTDEQLVQEEKKQKAVYLTYSVLLGIMLGVAIYSTVNKGLGFFTFSPYSFFPWDLSIEKTTRLLRRKLN